MQDREALLIEEPMDKRTNKTASLTSHAYDELPEDIRSLISHAKEAAEKAHAPYSNFLVGAALLLEEGNILTGNNQENAVFPAGICAERVVLTYAHANWPQIKPLKIAVVARRRDKENYAYVTPCGICRQTLTEYEQKFRSAIEIYMLGPDDQILIAAGVDDLLPFKFSDF
jgi:cytidine deaminase